MGTIYRFEWKTDDADTWTERNPVLRQGEAGYESDTYRFKIGDGVTPWNSNPDYFIASEAIQQLIDEYFTGGNGDPRVGNLGDLTTTNKDNLVEAVNEVNDPGNLVLLYDNAKAG